jgi:hypothetical protein
VPIAIDPSEETPYTLERERGKPDAATFHLKALNARQRMAIKDAARVIGADPQTGEMVVRSVNVDLMLHDYAAAALSRVDGMRTASGKPFRFRKGDLSFLSESDIRELGSEVQRLNELTEVEAKNS